MRPSYTELAAAQRQAAKATRKAQAAVASWECQAKNAVEAIESLTQGFLNAKAAENHQRELAKNAADRAEKAEKILDTQKKLRLERIERARQLRRCVAFAVAVLLILVADVVTVVSWGNAPDQAVCLPFCLAMAIFAVLLITDTVDLKKIERTNQNDK